MTDTAPTTGKPRPDRRSLRFAARLYAVQALFQMEASDQSADRVTAEFRNWRIAIDDEDGQTPEADDALFRKLLDTAVSSQARIDQLTDKALVARWPIDRLDPVLRAVFRAAGAELVQNTTPPRVVITEYVQVAQAFFDNGREAKFVNAVLDHMARALQPEAFGP